jgi:pimeloyl-ACP methyl ester carboxylesterase
MKNKLSFLLAIGLLINSVLPPNAVAIGGRNNRESNINSDANSLPNIDATSAPPCMSWISPVVKPRFAMLCIHGLGLYSRAYADFGKRMSRHGAAVYAIDVRGFGAWMKAEGKSEVDFDACLEDVRVTLQAIHRAHPGLPVFLLGESMGGAIALRAASMYPDLMDGLISAVPAEERFQQKKTDLKVAMEMLRGPNRQFDIGSQIVEQASTADVINPVTGKSEKIVNQKLVQDWTEDPLARMKLSSK